MATNGGQVKFTFDNMKDKIRSETIQANSVLVHDIVEGGKMYLDMKSKEPVLEETHELFKGIDYRNHINGLQLLYMQGNSGDHHTISKEFAKIYRSLERTCGLKKMVTIRFMDESGTQDLKK